MIVLIGLAVALYMALEAPAVRHDWGCCAFGPTPWAILSQGASGWNAAGIGAPNAYPATYIISVALAATNAMFGETLTRALSFFTICIVTMAGTMTLSRQFGNDRAISLCAALAALFNPWTYNEVVAGHVFMLFAYALTFPLAAACVAKPRSPNVIVLLLVLTLCQLQFFVIDAAVVLWVVPEYRGRMLAAIVIVASPIIVGVLFEKTYLTAIPYAVSWQRSASLEWRDAPRLIGYFTTYDRDAYAGIWRTLLWFVPAAVTYAAFARRTSRRSVVFVTAALLVLASLGLKGPTADAYGWVVRNVVVSALYRELYDVIGFVVACYIVILIDAAPTNRLVRACIPVATILLGVGFVVQPPNVFWVNQHSIASVPAPQASANHRVLFVPAFQPLRFMGRGSGLDPGALGEAHNVTALNDYTASYPADAAIAGFERTGSVAALEALSVEVVAARPGFAESRFSQSRLLPSTSDVGERAQQSIKLEPLDELVAFADIRPCILPRTMRVSCVLPIDERRQPEASTHAFAVPRPQQSETLDMREQWVAANTYFAALPEIAQPYGGVVTSSPTATYTIERAERILIWVNGALSINGSTVSGLREPEFRWIATPPKSELSCRGVCVVALVAHRPDGGVGAYESGVPHYQSIAFTQVTPWLALTSELPSNSLIRFNTRFDSLWIAVTSRGVLEHFRISGAFNGWASEHRHRAVLIEVYAAIGAVLECAAVVFTLFLGARIVRRRTPGPL